MKSNKFPAGWDEDRVKRLLERYDDQTEEEAIAEDEAAFTDQSEVVMGVPRDLVPLVRELIAKHQQ
jgi:aminoglycoside/choline kinase family phosphotransferase